MGAGWFDVMGAGWFDQPGMGAFNPSGGGVFAMAFDTPIADQPIPSNLGAKYPATAWDPDLRALEILPQFLGAGFAINVNAPAQIVQTDVDDLLTKAVTIRPERLGEIVQQDKNFQVCWLQLLMISRNSHPATYLLMKMAARVGEVAMIYCKLQYPDEPRPSQICPTLYPPVPVAGHSTYPAGHALIARLTSEVLKEVYAEPGIIAALDIMAARVGDNRVTAGLHFQRDIDEGDRIALQEVFPQLQACALYQSVLSDAQAEWP